MKNPSLSQSHLLVDKVNVNLDVLRSSMMNRVRCHINNTDIVTIGERSLREGYMKLLK